MLPIFNSNEIFICKNIVSISLSNLFNIPPRSSPPPQTSNTQNQNRDASSEKSPAINVEVEISLEDAYKGKLERVSFERKVTPGRLLLTIRV